MGSKRTSIPKDELRRLYLDELRSMKAIAQVYGVSSSTVRERMLELGIPIRTKASQSRINKTGSPLDPAEVVRLYLDGYSSNDICHILHSSKTTILSALRSQGVKIRSNAEAGRQRRNAAFRRSKPLGQLVGQGQCGLCGETRNLELHHVNADPRDHRPENLLSLCWEHHVLLEALIHKALTGIRRIEAANA